MKPLLPSFLLITDDQRKLDPWPEIVRLAPGDGVVFRHYGDPSRTARAISIAKRIKDRGLILLIAQDWRLAARIHAQGVHLPEYALRSHCLAPLLGWARRRNRIITAACHNRLALARAEKLKLSAVLISPVLPTQSHPELRGLGLVRFATLSKTTPLPVYGLGGVRQKVADHLLKRIDVWGVASTIPLKSKRQRGTNPA